MELLHRPHRPEQMPGSSSDHDLNEPHRPSRHRPATTAHRTRRRALRLHYKVRPGAVRLPSAAAIPARPRPVPRRLPESISAQSFPPRRPSARSHARSCPDHASPARHARTPRAVPRAAAQLARAAPAPAWPAAHSHGCATWPEASRLCRAPRSVRPFGDRRRTGCSRFQHAVSRASFHVRRDLGGLRCSEVTSYASM